MKVNYTLPGQLPEASSAPAGSLDGEPFGAQLQRLRTPEFTDWRAVLRLGGQAAGATTLEPPPAPGGTALRDGTLQRTWWRNMLDKHLPQAEAGAPSSDGGTAVRRMFALLSESQRREDAIFARHFADQED